MLTAARQVQSVAQSVSPLTVGVPSFQGHAAAAASGVIANNLSSSFAAASSAVASSGNASSNGSSKSTRPLVPSFSSSSSGGHSACSSCPSSGRSQPRPKEKEYRTLPWMTHLGPWESIDAAHESLNAQWKLSLDGVGVLQRGSSMTSACKDSDVKTHRKQLYCYQNKKAAECKFNIVLKQLSDGQWEICSVGPDCNHANPKTAVEMNTFASHREISEDLLSQGIRLRQNGAKTSFVFRYLSALHRDRNHTEPPFTYHDVFNAINPHKNQTAMDSTGFIQYLQGRKDDQGLDFDWLSDEEGSIANAFFVFKNAVRTFSDGSRPVLFDTKHGSNRYGLRLGIFSTVGRDGSTILLGASLLAHEDQQSFEWAFNEFRKAFGTHPHCIFTDGDKAMAAAIRSTWPETKHFLCTWHLSQTIIKNTKGDHAGVHPQGGDDGGGGCKLWVYTHRVVVMVVVGASCGCTPTGWW